MACLALAGCGGDEPGTSPPAVVIWAVGDGGVPGEPAREVAELIARDDPDRVLYLGDVYETGTAEEFRGFGEVFGPLLERMWPTPGNHDWQNHATGYDPFWRDVRGRPQPHDYERRAGGWEVISANSETPDDREQLRRLGDYAAGGGNCRIAFWHRPRFNAGEHRGEEAAVAPLWETVKTRAAILLSGHDHNVQRFEPVDGTVQYVVGAGGRGHYGVDESDPRLAFSDDTADAALRIRLTPGTADLRFIAADGTELDRSTVRCEG